MSVDLSEIERCAADHLERCESLRVRMTVGSVGPGVNPGIVPKLCRDILMLVAEVKRLRAEKRR